MAAKSNHLFYKLHEIENVPFHMYRLVGGVCSTSCFSEVDFIVEPVIENGSRVALAFSDLFKVDVVNDVKAEHAQAVEFIRKSRSYQWPPPAMPARYERYERHICKVVCNEIFIPLCAINEVVLEKRYRKIVSGFSGLSCKDLGLGTVKTWHGTPDAIVRGTPVVVSSDDTDDFDDTDDTDDFDDSASDGWSTTVEAKKRIKVAHLPQAIATAVVASFTEHNCHSSMNPMVPTILIDGDKFRVLLYDCKKDVLLMSPVKQLSNATHPRLSSTAMTLLWVVINHRYVFVPEVPLVNIVCLSVCNVFVIYMSLLSIQAVSETVRLQQVFLWVL